MKRNGTATGSKSKTIEPVDELAENEFSRFYVGGTAKKPIALEECASKLDAAIKQYRHSDAIDFAEMTWTWASEKSAKGQVRMKRPRLPNGLASFIDAQIHGTHAFYRVIAVQENAYTLMACHVNVHAFHRGDLRFVKITEHSIDVNNRQFSLIGSLFLGDIVAVTKLRKIDPARSLAPTPTVFEVNHEKPCIWEVDTMGVMKRNIVENATFGVLENGTAVVKGYDEVMDIAVKSRIKTNPDKLYTGHAFVPYRCKTNYTTDFPPATRNAVLAKAAKIASYPNAAGVIFKFAVSSIESERFDRGTRAFTGRVLGPDLEEREKTVQTCAQIGYSAANAASNGRFDCRPFAMIAPRREGAIVRFAIPNPRKYPTEGRWNCNTRIKFSGKRYNDLGGVIESVIADHEKRQLNITARISRDAPRNVSFAGASFVVAQRESVEALLLRGNFLEKMERECNGRRIIETLYGGPPIAAKPRFRMPMHFTFPSNPAVTLNTYQNDYVQRILDKNPMVLASSPFGCGKSMTIVTAALQVHKEMSWVPQKDRKHEQQLLITQSNYASVNLVDIARKVKHLNPPVKFVRYITDRNWKELPDDCQTEYDLPSLMDAHFKSWALGGMTAKEEKKLSHGDLTAMLVYVMSRQLVNPKDLVGHAARLYKQDEKYKSTVTRPCVELFLKHYRPDIFMTTADSLQGLLPLISRKYSYVSTIQIDEASQVPEYILINLFTTFPDAHFGLIGDVQQLPPYCDERLTGKLKEYGVGNTMERAIANRMFPQSILRCVYRCHPKTTELLSDLFYDGKLISGVEHWERNSFVTSRWDIWPNPDFPMIIVDNKEPGYRMGTSTGNKAEVALVEQIVAELKNGPSGLKPTDIGVISFYAAQTSVLTEALRGSGGVKCGTVDAFQGTEREVLIVCCTNERLSDFMQLGNRLNVALSRARQATIIIGCVDGMRGAKKYWNTIVKRVEAERGLVDTSKHPWKLPESHKSNKQNPKRAPARREQCARGDEEDEEEEEEALDPRDDLFDDSTDSWGDEDIDDLFDDYFASLKL